MESLRELYKKGLNENKRYFSMAYCMVTEFTEQFCELEKCLYLTDLDKKEKRLTKLLETKRNHFLRIERNPYKSAEDLGIFKEDYKSWKNEPLIFARWVWDGVKRQTILHNYIEKILKTAEKITTQKKDTYDAICYLIDERFKWHGDIFDNKIENYFFSEECTHFIFDVLRLKELELSKLEKSPIEEFQIPTSKPLKWTGDITALGTMFGVLIDEKVIDGRPADVKRALLAMFEGLSPSTLTDNLGLKRNKSEARAKYHKETEKIIRELAEKIKKK